MVLYPAVGFYWKRFLLLILGINGKKPASESLIFNKLQAWGLHFMKKETSEQVFSW